MFFWSYPRSSWQWDVLCVLILVFIFLTPKSWFETSELRARREHQTQVGIVASSPIYLAIGDHFTGEMSKNEIEERVRQITKRTDVRVTNVRERRNQQGAIVAYEVDIQ
jgi:hypothetical protein